MAILDEKHDDERAANRAALLECEGPEEGATAYVVEPCADNHFWYVVTMPSLPGRIQRFYTLHEATLWCAQQGKVLVMASLPTGTAPFDGPYDEDDDEDDAPLFDDEGYGEVAIASNGDMYLSY